MTASRVLKSAKRLIEVVFAGLADEAHAWITLAEFNR